MGLSPDALYNAIYLDVIHEIRDFEKFSHIPFPGCSYRQFASSYLLSSIIRKWIPKDAREADAAALRAFTAANNSCKDWSFHPDEEVDLWSSEKSEGSWRISFILVESHFSVPTSIF